MIRNSLTLPSALTTVSILLLSFGCGPRHRVKPVEDQAARARPTPASRATTRALGEERLSTASGSRTPGSQSPGVDPTGEPAAAPPAVQPPDPQLIVASIGPSTSPQRAASIRLTDEGRRLLDKGDTAGAVDRLEKALKVDPSNAHGYYCLAQVYDRIGRPDQALGFVDKAIVLFAQDDRAWLAQAYTFQGSILERTGRFRDARASYQHALLAEPGSVAARAGAARVGDTAAAP